MLSRRVIYGEDAIDGIASIHRSKHRLSTKIKHKGDKAVERDKAALIWSANIVLSVADWSTYADTAYLLTPLVESRSQPTVLSYRRTPRQVQTVSLLNGWTSLVSIQKYGVGPRCGPGSLGQNGNSSG